jgi:hypothetical protein
MLLGTGRVHCLVDKALRAGWHSAVIAAATDLHQTLILALERQIACLARRHSAVKATAAMHPPDLSEWLVSRALDDAVAAIEVLENLHALKDMNSMMKLLVHASR